jgi:glucan 1,3-beta-glucosidase
MKTSSSTSSNPPLPLPPVLPRPQQFTRGVNIGGWLVLERYITPYQFALTSCHIAGDFCWYPGQISAPPKHDPAYQLCDLYQCRPIQLDKNGNDKNASLPQSSSYPLDEYTLAQAFGKHNKDTAAAWLNYHFEHFITENDVKAIRASGLSHVRVPIPHWILEDPEQLINHDEPWIAGDRWKYFIRFCEWCRLHQLQVWPDVHTAPGSQNGFDNSGQALKTGVSCQGWSNHPEHVARSLRTIRDVTARIVHDGVADVVTGFGLLNEPFKDCDRDVYQHFIEEGLDIVRTTLGPDTAVYVSDMFLAKTFNDGHWWLDPARYNNTYLDSHYYHVFADQPRALSPRQHIAYVCENEYRDATSCCYTDGRRQQHPSRGAVQRIVGEWSAATDALPMALLQVIMDGIRDTGVAPQIDRTLSAARQDYLYHFVEAQMVAYEAVDAAGVGAGWFYWTVKMEGGAFAEWDYLRAVREGWMPEFPTDPGVPCQDVFGTCYDIIFKTSDDVSIIHEFPDPATLPATNWQGVVIDDDVVVSHGDSLLNVNGHYIQPQHHHGGRLVVNAMLFVIAGFFTLAVWRFFHGKHSRKVQYTELATADDGPRNQV